MKTGSMKIFTVIMLAFGLMRCTEPDPSFSLLADNDNFLQSTNEVNTKIDILWVIDNSGSMRTSQDQLVQNFEMFIDGFRDRGYDFQMAVTTTEAYIDLYNSNTSLSIFRDGTSQTSFTGYPIVTPQTPNFEDVFLVNVLQGIHGSGDERAFSSFQAALDNPLNSGFSRQDSFLAVIIVSDEDDLSHEGLNYIGNINHFSIIPTQNYVDYLDDITLSTPEFKKYSVSAIAIFDEDCRSLLNDQFTGRRIGARYEQLVDLTGGKKGSLCDDFANTLDLISEGIIQLATQFYLSRKPQADTIQVYVNKQLVPEVSPEDSPKNGWQYNSQNNSVMFFGSAIPPQGADINIVYDPIAVGQ